MRDLDLRLIRGLLWALDAHLLGGNILAQAHERALPDQPLVGALGKFHLGHQLRPQPGDALLARRIFQGALLDSQLSELFRKRAEALVVEAGADLAGIHQLARLLVHAQDDRAEARARAFRRGIAGDDEVLPQPALELDPALGAAGGVDRFRLLADQPFEAELARVLEHLGGAAGQVLAEAHAIAAFEHFLQARLALAQAELALVLAVEERRVEHVVHDLRIRPGLERVLQRLEARAPIRSRHHDLAVEPGLLQSQLFQRARQVRQLRGPVVTRSRKQPDAFGGDARQHAISVVLHLVYPVSAFRRRGDQRGELWSDESR